MARLGYVVVDAGVAVVEHDPDGLVGPPGRGDANHLDLGELEFRDEAADPTADGRMRRNGDTLTLRMQDARTATVARPWAIQADTTGTPAAGIGVGMRFDAESGDESPSQFATIDAIATDVTAGSEDTVLAFLLRVAGRALDEKYRFVSTAGDTFGVTFTHAVTADRTYTLPDASDTLEFTPTRSTQDVATSETTTSTSYTDLATSGPAVTLSPGRTTDQVIFVQALLSNNSGSRRGYISVAISAAADRDAAATTSSAANEPNAAAVLSMPTSVANGSTQTAKYRVTGGQARLVIAASGPLP